MILSRPVSLALVGLFLWQTGCVSYRQIAPNEVTDHEAVRVTLADGDEISMRDPTTSMGTLTGEQHDKECCRGPDEAGSVTVPLTEVREIEVSEFDSTKTAILGVFLAAATAASFTVKIEGYSRSWSLCCSE